jgi:hypothetical protein
MKKYIVIGGICCILIPLFFTGCTTDLFSEKAKIIEFKFSKYHINYGETSELSWVVENADTVTIDNGIGNVGLKGSRIIQPLRTTYYTLKATKSGRGEEGTIQIIVNTSSVETPAIQFVKDAIQMTLTVAQLDTENVLWLGFEIVNSTTTYSVTEFNALLTGYVNAGDTLYFTDPDTYKLRFTPTNTLIGEWTFA